MASRSTGEAELTLPISINDGPPKDERSYDLCVVIPLHLNRATYKYELIDTEVHVYKDIWLDRNESSLTLPLEMKLEHPFLKKSMIFTYHLEPEIELKYALE